MTEQNDQEPKREFDAEALRLTIQIIEHPGLGGIEIRSVEPDRIIEVLTRVVRNLSVTISSIAGARPEVQSVLDALTTSWAAELELAEMIDGADNEHGADG